MGAETNQTQEQKNNSLLPLSSLPPSGFPSPHPQESYYYFPHLGQPMYLENEKSANSAILDIPTPYSYDSPLFPNAESLGTQMKNLPKRVVLSLSFASDNNELKTYATPEMNGFLSLFQLLIFVSMFFLGIIFGCLSQGFPLQMEYLSYFYLYWLIYALPVFIYAILTHTGFIHLMGYAFGGRNTGLSSNTLFKQFFYLSSLNNMLLLIVTVFCFFRIVNIVVISIAMLYRFALSVKAIKAIHNLTTANAFRATFIGTFIYLTIVAIFLTIFYVLVVIFILNTKL